MADKTADIERIREAVESRRQEAEQLLGGKTGDPQRADRISSEFISECLYANAAGDGILFAELFSGKLLYHNIADEWLAWDQHHWKWDHTNSALKSMESICQVYLEEAHRLVDRIDWALKKEDKNQVKSLQARQRAIYRRVDRLRGESGRNNALKFARSNSVSSLDTNGHEFDTDPWRLACKNGVVDLKTGELIAGKPEHYIIRACPVEYTGIDTPAPHWEQFLREILRNNIEMVEFIQRLFGYGITGLTVEHIVPVLWGEAGRNGKGTMVETLMRVLGDYADPIQSEMLLSSKYAKSAAGPSPDIMDLKGLRIAFASETDEHRWFSTSQIKWLSGGDTLKGRWPHEKRPMSFQPTHLLVMMTNNKPHAPAEDAAFWERIHLIPFEMSFVKNRQPQGDNERQADIYLRDKLLLESSGILAWLVRGCLAWQERGLDPPPIVIEATAEYRKYEDDLADFIDSECYIEPKAECAAKDLYERFQTWWEQNISKRNVPTQKKFGKLMAKKFKKEKHGTYFYYGLDLVDHSGSGPYGR